MNRFIVIVVTAVALVSLAPAGRAQDNDRLAAEARTVLKTHCQRCHSGPGSEGNFDVLNEKTLLTGGDGEKAVVVAGKPDESKLWLRAGVRKNMPPKGDAARPSDTELAAVKKWIEVGAPPYPEARRAEPGAAPAPKEPLGAPAAEEKPRTFLPLKSELTAVRAHLLAADAESRPYLRYFSLTHLFNNPRVPDGDLAVYRAALSKALNSMSWKPRIVLPEAADPDGTVYAVDIRDLDWDRDHAWKAVTAAYPYGLTYESHPDRAVQKLDDDVRTLTRCLVPVVRADWFVATATKPPLYHALLKIPKTAGELEARLKVDVAANFRRDRLDRSGFPKSGVSEQNRLVERHDAAYGAYWKSYDFKKGTANSDLTRFPLGPNFKGAPYPEQAFEQAGGEIIFNLPNGLQGYMLVDAKDTRIDEGPQDVVNDSQRSAGSHAIANGLSCMACHTEGMKSVPPDTIREGAAVFGEAKRKVARLYPEAKRLTALVNEDRDRFLKAAEKATGPFLRVGADKDKAIELLPEPVGQIARLYHLQHLTVASAAHELGIEKPDTLKGMLQGNRKLRAMGIAPLAQNGGLVERVKWESGDGFSLMQRVARELDLGTPVAAEK